MKIKSADFVISNTDVRKAPAADRPEYAFIGRSNVGKSTLINALTQRKNLAKTSSTPGKTQLINHFNINDEWYLVDLPGYGYARVAKKKRKGWSHMIQDYLLARENLVNLYVLIDIRHEPQTIDLEFINQLGEWGIPFTIVFTKSDKIKNIPAQSNVAAMKKELSKTWDELPTMYITSGVRGDGIEDILTEIEDINSQLDFQSQS